MHLSEQDRIDFAHRYGIDPNSGYYAAGQIVGAVTTGVAAIAVTGGLAGATQAGTLWNIGRAAAHGYHATAFASDGAHIVRAGAEFAQTGDWTARQSTALLSAGAHGNGFGLARLLRGGFSWSDAQGIAEIAVNLAAGLSDCASVPKIPGKINLKRPN